MEDQVIQISDVNQLLARRWKTVGGLALLGALGALVYTLVVPAQWRASALVLVPETENATAQIAAIGQNKGSTLSILAGVMGSHSSLAAVAEKTQLPIAKVNKRLRIESDPLSGQVIASFTSKSKEEAMSAVQTVINRTRELDRTVGFSMAGRQAAELEKSVKAKAIELRKAEDELRVVQSNATTSPADPDKGTSYLRRLQELELGLIGASKRLEAAMATAQLQAEDKTLPSGSVQYQQIREELLKAETEFEAAKRTYTEKAPEYQAAKRRLDSVQKTLQGEVSLHVRAMNKGLNERIAGLTAEKVVLENQVKVARRLVEAAPGETIGLQRALRKVRLADMTYSKVLDQYEQATINAQTSKVKWTVLDEPYLDEDPVNKNFIFNIAVFGFLGAVVGVFIVTRRGG